MNFRKLLAGGSWLLLGAGVMAVSLWQSQRAAIWGWEFDGESADLLMMEHKQLDMEVKKLADDLPEVRVLPGEFLYPIKVVHDWVWWRMSNSEQEKARRWLYLANDRLRSGWELCHQDRLVMAMETYGKAEHYLQRAVASGYESEELDLAIERHNSILKAVERHVPEELRPRVTELLSVSDRQLKGRSETGYNDG